MSAFGQKRTPPFEDQTWSTSAHINRPQVVGLRCGEISFCPKDDRMMLESRALYTRSSRRLKH